MDQSTSAMHLSRTFVEPTNTTTSPQSHMPSTIVDNQHHQLPNSTINTQVHTEHIPQSTASNHQSINTTTDTSITNIQQEPTNNNIRKRPIELDPIETMDLDIDESISSVPATKETQSIQPPNQPSNTASTTTISTMTNSRTTVPRRLRVGISKRSLANVPGEHQPIVPNINNSNDIPSTNAR